MVSTLCNRPLPKWVVRGLPPRAPGSEAGDGQKISGDPEATKMIRRAEEGRGGTERCTG